MLQPSLSVAQLPAVDTMTKYPSIPTYHGRLPGSGLLDEDSRIDFPGEVIATEKVDGTNVRLIFWPGGGYLIGSRERLLYASGDLVGNPELGIVAALKPIADRIDRAGIAPFWPVVMYLELYGGRIGQAATQYRDTDPGQVGWRLFDVAMFDAGWPLLLNEQPETVAARRDAGKIQRFCSENELTRIAEGKGIALTPRLFSGHGADLPTTLAGVGEMLAAWDRTLVGLADKSGLSEGIVLRAPDRSVIAKVRREDYARALRARDSSRRVR